MAACELTRTRVKICGITRAEDALHAVRCGADALGFVFYEGSPRCVMPEDAHEIIRHLPPFVTTVGLFVNEARETIARTAKYCALDAIQLHGDERPQECCFPGYRVIKALRLRDASSVAAVENYENCALLLDAWVADRYGGTGHCCDWTLAAEVARRRPITLAGGLGPDNVADAIVAVRPYAVDVSSGVESAPGCKDPSKVAAFIRNANAVRYD